MITRFFKQSKPIVYVILGFLLSLFYVVKVIQLDIIALEWLDIILIVSKLLSLLICFSVFSWALKYFELQKYHSYGALFFVLFSSFFMPEILQTHLIFGLLFLEFGLVRLLAVVKTANPTLNIFEATLLIVISGLLYEPFMYLILLILVGVLIFLSPQWRFFVAPILAISAVVVLVQMYHLVWFDKVVYFDFFMPKPKLSFNFNFSNYTVLKALVWLPSELICIYEIIRVKQKKALYFKEMATFFLSFLGFSLIAFGLTNTTLSELWALSLWPLSIYIADFFSNLKSRLWREVMFWSFVVLAFANVFS